MKSVAIILAAGQGKRMKSSTPKQFLLLNDRPILYYTLKAFQIDFCKKNIVEKYSFNKVKDIVAGGNERFQSVYCGLKSRCVSDSQVVLIHDGARPFVSDAILMKSIQYGEKGKCCVVGTKVKDTIKVADNDMEIIDTPDRNTLWQIQTPQTFPTRCIVDAYEQLMGIGDIDVTDDAMVMERYGGKNVSILEGDYRNIKITTPEDLLIANAFFQGL